MKKLYKSILFSLIASSALHAQSLKQIIDISLQNNNNIKSMQFLNQSKQKSYDSVSNVYNPSVTLGANYTKLDMDIRSVQVGDTTVGFVKVGISLYDGGKNKAIKNQKLYEYKSSQFDLQRSQKELVLQVVTLFYQIKSIQENINALYEKSDTLDAQLKRVKLKYEINMVTQDEVLKLQSEYESNRYMIEELKYQKSSMMNNLSILAGSKIDTLDNSVLPTVDNLQYQQSENIKSLSQNIKALDENVKVVSSIKKPQLKIEDSLSVYEYSDYNEQLLKDLPNKQNQLMLSLSYNLFDTSSKSKKEVAILQKMAKKEQLEQLKKQEEVDFELSKLKLKTQELKIKSSKSALDMASSLYDIVKIKYQNGVVDNITYLDALDKKTINLALYKQALNDYEIAKANYYFNSGVNYKEFLHRF